MATNPQVKVEGWLATIGESRPVLVHRATRLRAEGLTNREIGEILGRSPKTVSDYLCDPFGIQARERKNRYRGVCVDCGGLTNGNEGRGPNAPKRCRRCAIAEAKRRQTKWTQETITAALREWAEWADCPPSSLDAMASAPSIRVRRPVSGFLEGGPPLPSPGVAKAVFGSWGAAVEAAGLRYEPFWRRAATG